MSSIEVILSPAVLKTAASEVTLSPQGAVYQSIVRGRLNELLEIEFLLDIVQPGMTFLDVGCNVGLFSLMLSDAIGDGRIFAFEPTTRTVKILKDNIALNGFENITPVHTALGNHIGKVVLKLNDDGIDGLNTIGKPTHEECKIVGGETVDIITLDDFVKESGIERVDLIKVDVEGAELQVFEGACRILNGDNPPFIIYESNYRTTAGFNYHPAETIWYLEACGYECFHLDAENKCIKKLNPKKGIGYMDDMILAAKPGIHDRYIADRIR